MVTAAAAGPKEEEGAAASEAMEAAGEGVACGGVIGDRWTAVTNGGAAEMGPGGGRPDEGTAAVEAGLTVTVPEGAYVGAGANGNV